MLTLPTSIQIAGTGLDVPDKAIDNQYFDELYQMDVGSFLEEKLNIKSRHWLADGQNGSDMATRAGQRALESAGLCANDIDLIIVATDTPDYISPSTATLVQKKLGAQNVGTFDVNSACAGFVTALDLAYRYLQTSHFTKKALVIGTYGMSRYLDPKDYKRATVFADGAGAVVLSKTPDGDSGALESMLVTDGRFSEYMGIFAGGTAHPLSQQVLDNGEQHLRFNERIPPEFNTEAWPSLVTTLMDRTDQRVENIDFFFFTQININSIRQTLAKLDVPESKTQYVMDRYGYTGSACIPMAMHVAREQGRVKTGDRVVLVASGGGVSMAALSLIW